MVDGNWVAWLGANPGIDTTVPFPTVKQAEVEGWQVIVDFFEDRFEQQRGEHDLRRGAFFSQLEVALDYALVRSGIDISRTLGRVGLVTDIVPWKFNGWGGLPSQMKRQMTAESRRRTVRLLTLLRPPIVIALGRDAGDAIAEWTGAKAPTNALSFGDCGYVAVSPDHRARLFYMPHPSGRSGAFCASLRRLSQALRAEWVKGH